jgi:hypothetical protein
MSGCLSLPFRILGVLLLLAGGALLWVYRRDVKRMVHEWTRDPVTADEIGRADPGRVEGVRRRVDSLGLPGMDSVVLSAADVGSVMALLSERAAPGAVDSIVVRLDRDDLEVSAVVDTRRLPLPAREIPGVLRDRERLTLGGPAMLRRAGQAEWQVSRVRLRGIPVPSVVVDGLLRRFSERARDRTAVFPLPARITGLRVTSAGVTLYGAGAR